MFLNRKLFKFLLLAKFESHFPANLLWNIINVNLNLIFLIKVVNMPEHGGVWNKLFTVEAHSIFFSTLRKCCELKQRIQQIDTRMFGEGGTILPDGVEDEEELYEDATKRQDATHNNPWHRFRIEALLRNLPRNLIGADWVLNALTKNKHWQHFYYMLCTYVSTRSEHQIHWQDKFFDDAWTPNQPITQKWTQA